MKNLTILLLGCIFSVHTFGQTIPQGINYQAVARDANGQELANQSLIVKFKIMTNLSPGPGYVIQWEETHNLSTNDYGLFTTIIGNGTNSGGLLSSFADIDWGNEAHSLKVEVDYGNGFVSMGTMPFQSVPYALSSLDNNWSTNGSDIYNNNAAGVGIGTDNPNGYILEIEDTDIGAISSIYGVAAVTDVDAHFDLNSNSNASWGSSINLFEFDENTQTFVDGWNIARQTTNGTGNSSLNFNYGTVHNNNSSSSKVTFTKDGKLGVGNANPGAKLEVYDNGDNVSLRIHEDAGSHEARLHLRRGGIDWELINGNGNDFSIEHEASEKFRIDGNTGNVGIGNSSPQYKLDVSGDINFTGDLYQNGSLVNFGSGGNSLWSSLGTSGSISFANNVGIGSGFYYGSIFGGNYNYPTNPLHVEDEGTEHGGTIDVASGIPVEEVVARFKNTKTTASPLTHSAVSVDAESGRDAIIYLSEDGDAKWGIRHDATDGSLEIRLQENGVNSKKFEITSSGEIKTATRQESIFINASDFSGLEGVQQPIGTGAINPQTYGVVNWSHYTTTNLAASVNLPNGAVITEIITYQKDSNDGLIRSIMYGRLKRHSLSSPPTDEVLSVFGCQRLGVSDNIVESSSETNISNGTIDNENYMYRLTCILSDEANFMGVKIKYNINTLN